MWAFSFSFFRFKWRWPDTPWPTVRPKQLTDNETEAEPKLTMKRHIMFFKTLTWQQITDLFTKVKKTKNIKTVWADTATKYRCHSGWIYTCANRKTEIGNQSTKCMRLLLASTITRGVLSTAVHLYEYFTCRAIMCKSLTHWELSWTHASMTNGKSRKRQCASWTTAFNNSKTVSTHTVLWKRIYLLPDFLIFCLFVTLHDNLIY